MLLEIYCMNENLNHDCLIENELCMMQIDMKYTNENLKSEKFGIYQKDFKYCCINYYFGKNNKNPNSTSNIR